MAKNYTRNCTKDSSTIMIPIYNPPQKTKKPNKCFVHAFATIVLLCTILLVFSCVVFLVKNPALIINSITIKSLSYDNSPTFDLTALMRISLRNRNFGHLDFDVNTNDTMSIIYGNGSVLGTSELKFRNVRVESRGEKEVQLEIKVSSLNNNMTGLKEDDHIRFSNDLSSGSLELIAYANFKGNVNLFKNRIMRSTIVHMNCTIDIDLRKQSVERLIC